MKTVLKVEGMSCGHCKAAVEKALKAAGAAAAEADVAGKIVTVEYDDKIISIEKMKAAVEDAGYETVI
jgi:copper chaperone